MLSQIETPAAEQFDFWLGEWDLRWGEHGVGRNSIRKILNGKVIQETFSGRSAKKPDRPPFRGVSLSVYNERTGQWQQTWVDSAGGYLDFTGGMVGDRMILQREAYDENGRSFRQRMVFANITADSLDWTWEKSDDDKAWQVLWHIHYTRRQE